MNFTTPLGKVPRKIGGLRYSLIVFGNLGQHFDQSWMLVDSPRENISGCWVSSQRLNECDLFSWVASLDTEAEPSYGASGARSYSSRAVTCIIRLDNVSLDAGHVLVHFLVTGNYRYLKP